MRTLKILGFLLTYPEETHRQAFSECRMFLQQENWLSPTALAKLDTLMQDIANNDLLDSQEAYVALFDRTPSLSLHLFEHVHGDSRERGQAMVDLSNVYADAGLMINTAQTPDYLPLFLEYAATLAPNEIQNNLGSVVNILSAIAQRLKNRNSAYAVVFEALVEAAAKKPDPKAVIEALEQSSGKAYDFEQLDKEWEEQFAFENSKQTTGQSSSCPKDAEMLARSS